MKYKLIVSDLDGTLLDSNREISKRTKELIKEFTEKGGIFTFATGRMEASVGKYLDYLDISDPVVIYNGAKVVDIKKGVVLFEELLEYDLAKTALKIAAEYEWDVLLYLDKKIYVNEITDVIEEYMLKDGVYCEAVGRLDEFLKCEPTKILIIGNPNCFAPYIEQLQKQINTSLNYVFSEHNYLEILPGDASKGSALKKFAESINISIEQTIAIGDNLNDLSMIKAAGLGVAVENAQDEVKKCADYITKGNDDEGVAEVIYKVINNMCLK
jgi:Cof subfamily protein (haloacid dehalogenase superfamily)